VLRLLRDELEVAMALTGCRTLAEAAQCLDGPGEPLALPTLQQLR
jgi:4-hydroxymandelate oxidase